MKHRRLFLSFFMVLILLFATCLMPIIHSAADMTPRLSAADSTGNESEEVPPVEPSEEVVELEAFIAECLDVDRFELRSVSLGAPWNCDPPIENMLRIGGYVTSDGTRTHWEKAYQITKDFHDHLAEHQYWVSAHGPIESLQPGMANIIRAYVQYGKEWSR